jgi:hypothetical protein
MGAGDFPRLPLPASPGGPNIWRERGSCPRIVVRHPFRWRSRGVYRSERDRMTTRKHLKRRVRVRAAQTGESYATALRNMRREQQESPMSAAAAPTEDVIASCSFCGKPNNKVAKIVAGPGVFICNECVELSAAIIADASQPAREESVRKYLDRPPEEILAMLPALTRSAARVEAQLAGWVGRLREQGTDWLTIGDALEMSAEAARQRFGPKPPA